jgi:heme A synthase
VVELHMRIAFSLVLYYAAIGIWGVFLGAVRKSGMTPGYRGALGIGVGLGVVQALVGLYLVVTGLRPADNLHFLYGATVILTLPLVMSYIVDKKISRPLAFGLACLFMAGLAIRAITTGGAL